MKQQIVRQGQIHVTILGTAWPTLYKKCVGSLMFPATSNHVTLKMQETAPTVYSPYSRRLNI